MLKVDFGREKGEIRRINGVNLGPRLYGSGNKDWKGMNACYQALNVPVTRFHDAPLDNPGMRLVDPNLIFANWHADANDPRNYYFRQTDDYLKICRNYDRATNTGIELHYRLGPSIEHSAEHYFIYPPEDFDKWIDICSNIIRHYNEGWNNGFAWNIKYWTIWEEPEQRRLWDGEPIQYFRLFKLAAKRLKERFPCIKLGTCVGNHLPPKWVADYLTYCRDEKVPMDFFGWSCYKGDLDEVIGWPGKIRKLIDGYGFKDTELHIAEWNYSAKGIGFSGKIANESPEGCYGHDGAAFAAAVLTGWQDTPLAMSNYYTAGMVMGLFDRYAVPKKNYYGLLAFGEIARYKRRVAAASDAGEVKILAGLNANGEGAILISAFKSGVTRLTLQVKGAKITNLQVLCVNRDLNLEPVGFKADAGKIVLEKKPGSSVFLVKGLNRVG